MKKGDYYFLIFLVVCITVMFCMVIEKGKGDNNELQTKVDSLTKLDQAKELRYSKMVDSFSIEKAAIEKANKRIDTFINNLLKKNESNKKRVFSGSDSLKLFVSDSLLRANGYK